MASKYERLKKLAARMMAATLACTLALSGVAAFVPQRAEALWSNHADTSWYDGSGEYYLSTPAQLAGLALLVNSKQTTFAGETVHLASDIDIGGDIWVPIGNGFDGSRDDAFSGTFDGHGHEISTLRSDPEKSMYIALFGKTYGGTIKNLSVSGDVAGSENLAGIVARASGSTQLVNLINKVNVTATHSWHSNVAGIVAACYGSDNQLVTIKNCANYGYITATDASGGVGGIAGLIMAPNMDVERCVNYAPITCGEGYNAGDASVGGLIGFTAVTGNYKLSECMNQGQVNAGATGYAGGLVGSMRSAGSQEISNCYNNGAVIGSAAGYAGGLVGELSGDADNVQIANTYNAGAVSGYYAGGLLGSVTNDALMNALSNSYYLDSTASNAVAGHGDTSDVRGYSAEFMASDEFRKLLSQGGSTDFWSKLVDGATGFPALTTFAGRGDDEEPPVETGVDYSGAASGADGAGAGAGAGDAGAGQSGSASATSGNVGPIDASTSASADAAAASPSNATSSMEYEVIPLASPDPFAGEEPYEYPDWVKYAWIIALVAFFFWSALWRYFDFKTQLGKPVSSKRRAGAAV